tara:strand:+ start:545 stop:826 length:282 start_codon:yes stop_codon:yes gene_type:complete
MDSFGGLNNYLDNLDDGYGIFDDVADSLDFASVGISTDDPDAPEKAPQKKVSETKGLVKQSLRGTKKRGRKPGQKPRCGICGVLGHTRRKCAR